MIIDKYKVHFFLSAMQHRKYIYDYNETFTNESDFGIE